MRDIEGDIRGETPQQEHAQKSVREVGRERLEKAKERMTKLLAKPRELLKSLSQGAGTTLEYLMGADEAFKQAGAWKEKRLQEMRELPDRFDTLLLSAKESLMQRTKEGIENARVKVQQAKDELAAFGVRAVTYPERALRRAQHTHEQRKNDLRLQKLQELLTKVESERATLLREQQERLSRKSGSVHNLQTALDTHFGAHA